MKYKLLKAINGIGDINTIIDSINYPYLDMTKKAFFERYEEPIIPLYERGEELLYNDELYYVHLFLPLNKMRISPVQINSKFSSKDILVNTTVGIKKLTYFWFINSNGEIQKDYVERKKISVDGLIYKRKSGNYFESIEEARIKWKSVMTAY